MNEKGQIVLDTTNTTVDWSEDTDTERHATIRFFYRRRTYNLNFRNGSDYEEESFTVPYGEYVGYTTSPQWILFPVHYYIPDLADYYTFDNWYLDPLFTESTSGFNMPSDDITLFVKWNPVHYDVSFYNDFIAYVDSTAPVNTCSVPYNEKILTSDIPVDEEHASLRLTPPSANAHFAGWYYLDRTGLPVRFDPENLPVTRDFQLYAAWETTDTAQYRIRYLEKDTDIEVADPDTGTMFVSRTRTFFAKTSDQYNEDHRWGEDQPNWWPVVSSHSILTEPNTVSDNEYIFRYVCKSDPVNYAIQYLDSETEQPITDPQKKTTYYAAVTETAPYIEGYVADSVTKSKVLSASELSGEAAIEEELQNNVIIFFYTRSNTASLYQVDHYIENIDGGGYTLYDSETISGIKNESVSVNAVETGTVASGLISSGFSCDHAKTTVSVDGAPAVSAGESVTLTGAPTILSVYYDRNLYAYVVKYIDYDQEKLYESDHTIWNGELCSTLYTGADKQPLGKDVAVYSDTLYTYTGGADPVNYTRVSNSQPILTIRHDDPDTPTRNILKIYYKEDMERRLNYRIVCDAETNDTFAVLSQSTEIVANLAAVKGSTVSILELDDHEYEFLGWFSTPEAVEANRLTAASVMHYEPAAFPGADMTYYAVFSQKTVSADVTVRYNDSGIYTDDNSSSLDADGSVTGHTITFTSPDEYVSGTTVPLDNTAKFTFDVADTDGKMYRYEFAGWYTVDDGVVSSVEPGSGESGISAPMTGNCRYIAMFKKRASVSFEIKYRFTTRAHGVQDYILKDTLTGDEITAALSDSASCELKNSFILENAPYESNYGETLSWSDAAITTDSSEEGGIVTVVTADQKAKTVYANYRLLPTDGYTTVETTVGANRENDDQLAAIDARELTFGDNEFSYWEIRKSSGGDVIAKCYDAWFSFCMMDSYYISPVFNGAVTPDSVEIKLTHLDYSRNRWTDENGDVAPSGETDLLYTDFEIAFEDSGNRIYGADSGYRTGVVFELCGKLGSSAVFDPSRDYGFYSDTSALKEAIKNNAVSYTTQNKPDNAAVKTRSIQCSEINTVNLTNKNRIEFAQYYPNAYTLVTNGDAETKNYSYSVYLMKATAYLVKDNEVTLSNSVYICFKTEAAKDSALPRLSS